MGAPPKFVSVDSYVTARTYNCEDDEFHKNSVKVSAPTNTGRPMGWQNGECALIQPCSRQGDWVMAQWNGVCGWINANYLYY